MKRKAKRLEIVSESKKMYILLKNEEVINYCDNIAKFGMDFNNFDEEEYYWFIDDGLNFNVHKAHDASTGFRYIIEHIRLDSSSKGFLGKSILSFKEKSVFKVVIVINYIKAILK